MPGVNCKRTARRTRGRELSPLLLFSALLAAALFVLPAQASLPRPNLDVAALVAEPLDSGRFLAATEPPFSVLEGDELEKALTCNPAPSDDALNPAESPFLNVPGIASRGCEARFRLHLEPAAFGLNLQRGPPLEYGSPYRGRGVADSQTRIGGFRLVPGDLIGGEGHLSLRLHWGCDLTGCGIAEDEPQDPLGLCLGLDSVPCWMYAQEINSANARSVVEVHEAGLNVLSLGGYGGVKQADARGELDQGGLVGLKAYGRGVLNTVSFGAVDAYEQDLTTGEWAARLTGVESYRRFGTRLGEAVEQGDGLGGVLDASQYLAQGLSETSTAILVGYGGVKWTEQNIRFSRGVASGGVPGGGVKLKKSGGVSSQTQTQPKEIYVEEVRHPQSVKHLEDAGAIDRELVVNRSQAASNRKSALSGKQKVPNNDLDESPPAFLRKPGDPVSVRAIGSSDNRGAGSVLGHQARGVPNGGKVIIRIIKPKPPGV